ncbi:MAG TPA: class I SAM-dependent methyltransferase [Burkholderiaceae bacterium]|nr:class I SAM-dependent methyltransferase [Burkholderiaceae bacterium]
MGRRRALFFLTAALASTTAHAQDEVPFVTSPHPVTMAMLKLARVQASDVVLDLGSGDGRIVIAAARQFGARGVGVELSPQLVQTSRDNAARAGVAGRTQFIVQDLFETDLAQASVITMYLLPEVNLRLRPKLLALRPGTRIVSHDWDMGDWQPDRTWVVDAPDKPVGLEKRSRVHLWVVPASLEGAWCSAGHALRLEQTYQELRGDWTHGSSAPTAIESRIQGRVVQLVRPDGRARLALHGAQLRVEAAGGVWSALRGVVFSRGAEGCR